MSLSSVERRLSQVSERIRQLRRELEVSAEQLMHLADAADDARLRSLVSETPVADRDRRQAERHAEAMRRHRAKVEDEIARLERDQDDLLDRFVAESKSR
jgi:predicted  nucleic acid-binding Zn-ribbon protein